MRTTITAVGLLILFTAGAASAQTSTGGSAPARGSVSTLLPKTSPSSAVSVGAPQSELAMIAHRAKVFGSRATAAGTRYFTVKDSDLFGMSDAAVIDRLAVHNVGGNVRRVDIVVDLHRPLTLHVSRGEQVTIGSAIVSDTRIKNIDVHATIFANQITVIRR